MKRAWEDREMHTKILVENPKRKSVHRSFGCRQKDNTETGLDETGCCDKDWIHLLRNKDKRLEVVHMVANRWVS
jgi:hypothetical protein